MTPSIRISIQYNVPSSLRTNQSVFIFYTVNQRDARVENLNAETSALGVHVVITWYKV